jgi:hypothetical protein
MLPNPSTLTFLGFETGTVEILTSQNSEGEVKKMLENEKY